MDCECPGDRIDCDLTSLSLQVACARRLHLPFIYTHSYLTSTSLTPTSAPSHNFFPVRASTFSNLSSSLDRRLSYELLTQVPCILLIPAPFTTRNSQIQPRHLHSSPFTMKTFVAIAAVVGVAAAQAVSSLPPCGVSPSTRASEVVYRSELTERLSKLASITCSRKLSHLHALRSTANPMSHAFATMKTSAMAFATAHMSLAQLVPTSMPSFNTA